MQLLDTAVLAPAVLADAVLGTHSATFAIPRDG